jgi:hypothetical protein
MPDFFRPTAKVRMSFHHPSTRPHNIISGGKKAVIWGETAILIKFFPAIVASAYVPGSVITTTVNSATVSRYPGDKGYARKQHSAKRLNKVPPKMGGALPGNPFSVRWIDADGNIDMSAIWQFRYQGSWLTIRTYAYDNLKSPGAVLYSPSGHPYLLPTELPRNPPVPEVPIFAE